jgi:DNA-binding response OmpR family regulator
MRVLVVEDEREVHRSNQAVELTAREFALLETLLRAPSRVFTRTRLLERVWGYDFDPETNIDAVAFVLTVPAAT